jgi:hypothetical protein
MARCEHLESELAALKHQLDSSKRTTSSERKRGRRDSSSAAAGAANASGSAFDDDDDDDDDDDGVHNNDNGSGSAGEGAAPRSTRRNRTPSLQMVRSLAHTLETPPRGSAKRRRSSGRSPAGTT